jgi:hypothetical protein
MNLPKVASLKLHHLHFAATIISIYSLKFICVTWGIATGSAVQVGMVTRATIAALSQKMTKHQYYEL